MKLKVLFGAILAVSFLPSIALAEMSLADKYLDLDIVNTQDLRDGDFDLPWSEVVIIEDDFDGDYLAVLDKEKSEGGMGYKKGAFSEWSKNQVKAYYYSQVKGMFGSVSSTAVVPAKTMTVKIGASKFDLKGTDGVFTITPEVVKAMKDNPDSIPKLKITPQENNSMFGFSEMVYEVGEDTLDAWDYIYQGKEIALEN